MELTSRQNREATDSSIADRPKWISDGAKGLRALQSDDPASKKKNEMRRHVFECHMQAHSVGVCGCSHILTSTICKASCVRFTKSLGGTL